MQTPKAGKKLKLPGTSTMFGKLRAALQSTGAFGDSERTENASAYEATEQYRTSLSAESARAAAEQIAYNLRRKIM